MTDSELDFLLARQETITPSSGFIESVMNTVRSEAFTPHPIPFPWKRALPGFVAAAILLALFFGAVLYFDGQAPALPLPPALPRELGFFAQAVKDSRAVWIVLSLCLSLVSVKVSMLIAASRHQRFRENS